MSEPCDLDAVDARKLITDKSLSPVELTQSCLRRISQVNEKLNAVVAMDEELAMRKARDDEAALAKGEDLGILAGLPVGIKDLNVTQGLRTTWGSLLFEDHVPDADDEMVANIRARGGNIFAKTNTPEFGAGANTTNRVYGPTGNPFDASKTCGGSSGGSAVALATGMLPLASGSDYGGSLRTPAAFCGITGFRPSPGVVPTTSSVVSLNPFAVAGPMGRTVADAHLLLRAQLDQDKRDPFSSDDGKCLSDPLREIDLQQLKVAWSADLGCAPIAQSIRETFEQRIGIFASEFGSFVEKNPHMDGIHDTFEVLRGVFFVAAHAERLANDRERLGPNVIDNTERGLAYSLADVARAHVNQSTIYKAFIDFFADIDVLICPAASVSPFPHSQLYVDEIDNEKMPTYMRWLAITYALTMALPSSCVIPCGVDQYNMPFGIQIAGPNGSDQRVLNVAYTLEKALAGNAETSRPIPKLV